MTWTPLEIAANLMTAICIFLAGRNSVHTWWTGIVACVLFGTLFYSVQLYADVTLQVFFVITGIIGWYGWVQRKAVDGATTSTLPISSVRTNTMMLMVGTAVLVAAAYGLLLHTFTNAYAPWIDSLVLTFSVIAQLLLMRRKIQTWPLWVIVNTLAVPLFWSRELYLTAGLYAVFWVHAIWAWKHWLNLMDDQPKEA